jgi:hypothetical protein
MKMTDKIVIVDREEAPPEKLAAACELADKIAAVLENQDMEIVLNALIAVLAHSAELLPGREGDFIEALVRGTAEELIKRKTPWRIN